MSSKPQKKLSKAKRAQMAQQELARRETIGVEEHEPARSTVTATLPAGTVTLRPAHEMPKRRSPPNRHERRRMAALARRRMRR